MKTRTMLALVCMVMGVLFLVACGQSVTPAPPAGPKGDAAMGQTKFTATCSACHGPAGEGVTGLGKDMTTSTFIKGLSDAELVEFIKKGRPVSDPANTTQVDMPPKGGNPALSDQDLADIVAYIRTLQK